MDIFTDDTVLTFGRHKGKKLANVPADWLLWYLEKATNQNRALVDYIVENKMILLQEVDLKNIKKNG